MAKETPQSQAEDLEARILELSRERASAIEQGPKISPRDLARSYLGLGGPKPPSDAELAKFDERIRRIDATIVGLIEMRIELEPAIIETEREAIGIRLGEAVAEATRLRNEYAEAARLERELDGKQRSAGYQVQAINQALSSFSTENGGRIAGLRRRLDALKTGDASEMRVSA